MFLSIDIGEKSGKMLKVFTVAFGSGEISVLSSFLKIYPALLFIKNYPKFVKNIHPSH
jgi:hypothetical protein